MFNIMPQATHQSKLSTLSRTQLDLLDDQIYTRLKHFLPNDIKDARCEYFDSDRVTGWIIKIDWHDHVPTSTYNLSDETIMIIDIITKDILGIIERFV